MIKKENQVIENLISAHSFYAENELDSESPVLEALLEGFAEYYAEELISKTNRKSK